MTIRIAYYSWKGHTRKVAEMVSAELVSKGSTTELVAIEPAQPFHVAAGAMRAFFKRTSPIRPCSTDMANTDALIIATPVWVGKIPPFVSEYLSSVTNGAGKPFYVIAEMGGGGADGAIALVRKHLEAKGMRFISSLVTVEKDVDGGTIGAAVSKFSGEIGKP